MRPISLTSAQYLVTVVLKKGNLKIHVESVYDNKKPQKCSFCNFSFFSQINLIILVKSVHEKQSHTGVQLVIIIVL